MGNTEEVVELLARKARALDSIRDLQPLVRRLSRARVVLLGESTHGTREFYAWRRLITKWLVVHHGFNVIAVEGDWPACRAVNEAITRPGGPASAGAGAAGPAQASTSAAVRSALAGFVRWPTWLWANEEFLALTEWLRADNERRRGGRKTAFYGLDIYSLFESIDGVLARAAELNPFLARRLRHLYDCFQPFRHDERAYTRSLLVTPESCDEEAAQALAELLEFRLDGMREREAALFDAQQNARIVGNAERYYRAMVRPDGRAWNIRDEHMADTLELLLARHGPAAKAIVWAHNSHVGDPRAIEPAGDGLATLGGLLRRRLGESEVALVGFGTHRGTVTASRAWDGTAIFQELPPARPGSWEDVFHTAALRRGFGQCLVIFEPSDRGDLLSELREQRAVGVVYDPRRERYGNYVRTSLSRRFDAFLFMDETHAVQPLLQPFDRREIPETWPAGL